MEQDCPRSRLHASPVDQCRITHSAERANAWIRRARLKMHQGARAQPIRPSVFACRGIRTWRRGARSASKAGARGVAAQRIRQEAEPFSEKREGSQTRRQAVRTDSGQVKTRENRGYSFKNRETESDRRAYEDP